MKYLLLVIILFASINICFAISRIDKQSPTEFFLNQDQGANTDYRYNPYENIIAGGAAFIIGNIGYLLSDGSFVKIAYAGIQTIGVVNIGRGIYQLHSPSIRKSFNTLVNNDNVISYSKDKLATSLIEIYAKEDRAKRLAMFYSSSFLTVQYLLNVFVYESPGNIKNVYMFIAGVNAIVAIYSAFYKSDYEQYYFGRMIDISPLIAVGPLREYYKGLMFTFNF